MSEPRDVQMTFGQHLDELRRRLIYAVIGLAVATGVCLYFGKELLSVLQAPVIEALRNAKEEPRLIVTNVVDPFMAYVKVSLIAGAVVASPWIFWQLWQFVAAGLFPHERKYVYIFAPVTLLLFLAGTVFSYFVMVRYGIQFLVNFGVMLGYRIMPEVNSQLTLVLILSVIMGVIFELPLVMLILSTLHIFDSRGYASKRRLFIVVAVAVAAIITPTGDAVNLALATAPIIVLYELGIWICRIAEGRRNRKMAG